MTRMNCWEQTRLTRRMSRDVDMCSFIRLWYWYDFAHDAMYVALEFMTRIINCRVRMNLAITVDSSVLP